MRKKLEAVAREWGCFDLWAWIPSVVNHLYWTAMSTPEEEDAVALDKWKSVVTKFRMFTMAMDHTSKIVCMGLWRGERPGRDGLNQVTHAFRKTVCYTHLYASNNKNDYHIYY